jgi:hypothetical protein
MDDVPELASVPADVVVLFEKLTWDVWETGRNHYSARAILHRIRWHYDIDRGMRTFKCNNNWTPLMSRRLMKKYPKELTGFFRIRVLKRSRPRS